MTQLQNLLDHIPWSTVILLCLTLGLAPFVPPHLYQKFEMLLKGVPLKPMDWLDMVFHGAPWVVLILKATISK